MKMSRTPAEIGEATRAARQVRAERVAWRRSSRLLPPGRHGPGPGRAGASHCLDVKGNDEPESWRTCGHLVAKTII